MQPPEIIRKPSDIDARAYIDHLRDARLAVLASLELIDVQDGETTYSLNTWRLREIERLRRIIALIEAAEFIGGPDPTRSEWLIHLPGRDSGEEQR